jgi:hypothetical protein
MGHIGTQVPAVFAELDGFEVFARISGVTLDDARKLLATSQDCAGDDAVRAVAGIALRAQSEAAGWARLRLEALRALGRYLIRHS